jgi:protein ImuA
MEAVGALAALRRRVGEIERACPYGQSVPLQGRAANVDDGSVAFGVGAVDRLFDGGGWPSWGTHEIAGVSAGDGAAASGFALALLGLLLARQPGGRALLVQEADVVAEHGALYAPGLQALGVDPDRLVSVVTGTGADALRVVDDALTGAEGGLVAVVGELRRGGALLNLAATRRFNVAARRAKVCALLIAPNLEATSASATRWRVGPARSVDPMESGNPRGLGRPAFALELMRNRAGRTGQFCLEWNSHDHAFTALEALSASVVPPPVDGSRRPRPPARAA